MSEVFPGLFFGDARTYEGALQKAIEKAHQETRRAQFRWTQRSVSGMRTLEGHVSIRVIIEVQP